MKKSVILLAIIAMGLLFSGEAEAEDWKKLGETTVRLSRDMDEIRVNDLGRYDYIKLKVRDQGVEFKKAIVVFGNGQRHELPVRSFIRKDGETLALRMPKGDRFIRKVILDYKTRSEADERARVILYGKRR